MPGRVGQISTSDGGSRTLIEHWNGKTWRQMPSPGRGNGADFYGVAATSARSAWAVGTTSYGVKPLMVKPLLAHWNGLAWK